MLAPPLLQVSHLHLLEHVFVFVVVVAKHIGHLLLFIHKIEDALTLLNHCGDHCVIDCVVNAICAKNVRHKGSNHTLHLHLVLLFEPYDVLKKLDEEMQSVLVYLWHSFDKLPNLLH